MQINSNTNLVGVIGYPLEKTLSPTIQNAGFKAAGLNWCYLPMPVKPENIEKAIFGLQALGFKGINITMPHKEAVMPFLDEIDPFAKLSNAVNTIRFKDSKIIGFNTDGQGFLQALEKDAGFKLVGKTAAIIGAGGAAHSISVILAQNNIKKIIIINRSIENANALRDILRKNFVHLELEVLNFNQNLPNILDSTDLIVNSTSVGWDGKVVVSPEVFHSGHLVVDLVYVPQETNLLKEAKKRGAKVLSGKLMLLYQGCASWEIWTEAQAPIEEMRLALNKELSKDESD